MWVKLLGFGVGQEVYVLRKGLIANVTVTIDLSIRQDDGTWSTLSVSGITPSVPLCHGILNLFYLINTNTQNICMSSADKQSISLLEIQRLKKNMT